MTNSVRYPDWLLQMFAYIVGMDVEITENEIN